MAHQHQLSTFMEQLDRFQKVQRQLVASKTSEDAKYFSAPVSFSGDFGCFFFGGGKADGDVLVGFCWFPRDDSS